MILDKMPNIFFNAWFWIGIAAVLLSIYRILGKRTTSHNKLLFFEKHKRTITRIKNILLILVMLSGWTLLIYFSVSLCVKPIFKSTHIPINELLLSFVTVFSIGATSLSGFSGGLIGLLSIFQSNLTKYKRLILFAVSVLPLFFMILAVLAINFENPRIISEKSQAIWTMVKIGFMSLVTCWFINGPAIIVGQNLNQVTRLLMRKLKLISGDFPE